MPMNDIYTLFNFDVRTTRDDVVALMQKISNSEVFDSSELKEHLDQFKVVSKRNLLERVLRFHQSTKNINVKIPDLVEITLS